MRGPREITGFGAGLMAVTAAVVAVWLAFGGPNPFHRPYELKAVVESGNELHSRTPVRIAGVDVGKVKKVERGPGSFATVTMELEQRALPLHRDATLKIRPRIFLEGNFFVDLSPGTPSAPRMKDGGTIPIAQTAIPVQLDQVLSALRTNSREDLANVVRELGDSLDRGGARALNESLPDWGPAFVRGAEAMEALRGQRPDDLSGALGETQTVVSALADRDTELEDAVTGLARTTGALAARRERLSESIVQLDAVTREASPAFGALNDLFPPARAVVADVRPGLRAAPATLRIANPLLTQLDRALSEPEIPALIREGDPAIRALARLQPHLRDLLARVTPPTTCIRKLLIPMLTTAVDDPPLTDGRPKIPIYIELVNGLVAQASGSQNFTGSGHALRYHAGFGDETFGTGEVPSVGEALVGASSEPVLGSRPRFTGVVPPVRPDVPCTTQKTPDMRAETGPAFGGQVQDFSKRSEP